MAVCDGNTWNHEHIALLGKCLTSPEEEGHKIVRHLADYVLIWTTRFAGMMGDDLAKSPHMARIAGSVYPDVAQEVGPAKHCLPRHTTYPFSSFLEFIIFQFSCIL